MVRTVFKRSWVLAGLLSLSLVAPVQAMTLNGGEPNRAADELDAQPHMKAARALLETAKSQLEKASHDKGGHRVKALAHTKLAIAEVNKGIQFDNQHSAREWDAVPLDAQPHMKSALSTLEAARRQLQKASPDKGGHRVKALKHVADAIAETKKAIQYDNQH